MTGLLILGGITLALIGAFVALTGRSDRLLRSRRAGSVAVAAALLALVVGGSLAPTLEEDLEPAAAAPDAVLASPPAPTPAPPSVPTEAEEATTQATPERSDPSAEAPTTQASAAATATDPPNRAEEPTGVVDAADETVEDVVPPRAVDVAEPGTALAALATLEVKGRAPKTGYDRDAFAYRNHDLDRNGCDTRIICIRVASQS